MATPLVAPASAHPSHPPTFWTLFPVAAACTRFVQWTGSAAWAEARSGANQTTAAMQSSPETRALARAANDVVIFGLRMLRVIQMPSKDFVTAGGFIYLSAMGPQRGPRPTSAAQTRSVIERARAALAAAGSSLDQVVAVMVYLKSAADFPAMNAVYGTFWPENPPTRTTIVTELATPGAVVEMSMVAVPAGAERTVVHPAGWLRSPSPYSYAIKSGDTVFLSGLVSRDARDNAVVAGDVPAQTKVIMDVAGEILEAAGLTHANIVSARIYLPELASFQPMNGAYRAFFPTDSAGPRHGAGRARGAAVPTSRSRWSPRRRRAR